MEKRECQRCEYFVFAGQPNIGYCRRNPPTVFKMTSKLGNPGIEAHFPVVQTGFWCGEFRAKIELATN